MTQAIGSATTGSANPGAVAATLDAQLTRYQKLLSECVNCDSSRTPEGQAQIQDISTRIAEVKARIDKVSEAGSSERTNGLATSKDASQVSAPKSTISTTGSIIDTTA